MVEIPVPALDGVYGSPKDVCERTAAFSRPGLPAVIRSTSPRIRGTTEVGRILCDDHPLPTEQTWFDDFFAEMVDEPSGTWVAEPFPQALVEGAFGWTEAFVAARSPLPHWAFLADGQGVVTLRLADTNYFCSPLTPHPSATVEEATLIVDADFAVPAAPRTWGRIKAAYR